MSDGVVFLTCWCVCCRNPKSSLLRVQLSNSECLFHPSLKSGWFFFFGQYYEWHWKFPPPWYRKKWFLLRRLWRHCRPKRAPPTGSIFVIIMMPFDRPTRTWTPAGPGWHWARPLRSRLSWWVWCWVWECFMRSWRPNSGEKEGAPAFRGSFRPVWESTAPWVRTYVTEQCSHYYHKFDDDFKQAGCFFEI